MPYEIVEDRYDGATEDGAEQNTLSACGNRTTKDKAELPIEDSESWVRQFWALCHIVTRVHVERGGTTGVLDGGITEQKKEQEKQQSYHAHT